MGRGGSTKQTNVRKTLQRINLESDIASSSGSGSTESAPKEEYSGCEFSFTEKTLISPEFIKIYSIGDPAALMPVSDKTLFVIVKGDKVTEYEGALKNKLLHCIQSGFFYEGRIIAKDSNSVTIKYHGNKR